MRRLPAMPWRLNERGAAMLEYAIVSCIVVIAALIPYIQWKQPGTDTTASLIEGYTQQTKSVVQFISLPCP